MSISIFFSNGWIESLAAERIHKEYNNEFYEETATDMDAECATESDGAAYSEINPLLNYLVVDKPSITTTDTQNILVGLGDGNVVFDNAVLYYENEENGTEYSSYAKSIDSESALFEILIDKSYTPGKYIITAVEYTAGGTLHTIYLQDAGVNASFGVDDIIETEADAYIEEDIEGVVDETISDAVIVSDDGAVTTQELESAVLSASDGAVMAKNKNEIVIVLDPGHGTPDGATGATYEWNGVKYIEKEINLKIAQYCKEELEKYNGVKVYMTRTTNDNGLYLSVPEGEMVSPLIKFAADRDADIFVSIHNNAADVATANGSEVYYPNANYNPEMSKNAEELSKKILDKLSECGLTNRGAKIRDDSGNVQYYPDGSLGDYYGVIRQSKLCGIPGIIIEHAFMSNQSDAENFLGSDESLKKLGQADAAALAEYFGLTEEIEYEEDAATIMAVQNNPDGSYTVVVSGVNAASGVSSVRIPVWSKQDLSDLYWYNAERQSDGTYVAHANIKNHKYNYGVYAMQAYVKAKNGVEVIAASKCHDFASPIPMVSTFKCDNEFNYILIAEDIPKGDLVTGVKFGVWNQGLSDLKWYQAGKDEFGRWLAVVGVSEYAKSGTYYGDAYVTLKDGSTVKLGGTSFKVSAPTVNKMYIDNADNIGGTFDVKIEGVNSASGIESIRVPVWSAADLSDIHWYDAKKESNGNYVVHVDISNHQNNYATYAVQVYIKAKNGVENIAASKCYTFKQPEEKLYKIMGSNGTSVEQMVKYYNSCATYPEFYATTDAPTIEDFCKIYIEECNAEGVKAEVAFCQAMKETGFLRFGGAVDISQFNFAGIGATDDGGTPATFTSVRAGIRAQVQHLKAYASDKPLVNECVDPRFELVTRETAPYVEWLGIQENPYGKGWASAKEYGYSLRKGYIEVLLSK